MNTIPANKQQNHARRHVGLVLALVGLISATALLPEPAMVASAQGVAPSWSYTGSLNTARPGQGKWNTTASLNTARYLHTATLLSDGKVLVTGGFGQTGASGSAELYDPSTGKWSFTGSLNVPREGHTATLLANGKVLVVGGPTNSPSDLRNAAAELYDPATGEWSITENLNVPSIGHTATSLIGNKAGKKKKIKAGDKLQVRNPSGTLSQEFTFTGS